MHELVMSHPHGYQLLQESLDCSNSEQGAPLGRNQIEN